MSKLRTFALDGLELFFNSQDHWPPHFHVRKPGCWEIRVFFLSSEPKELDFKMKWPLHKSPSSKEQSEILKQVLKHRDALLQEWEQKVCVKEKF